MKTVTNASVFDEKFVKNVTTLFPATVDWFSQTISPKHPDVDVEGLAEAMGLTITWVADQDLPYKSKLYPESNTLVINSNLPIHTQRWEISSHIGLMLTQRRQELAAIDEAPIGKSQPLPEAVFNYLEQHGFRQTRENALADAVHLLDHDAIAPIEVTKWWSRDDSEVQLANAYLFGYHAR